MSNNNAGSRNAGSHNAGGRNTGDFNAGSGNAGFFCTETPAPMFFDLPTTLTWDEALMRIPRIELPEPAIWIPSEDMTAEEKMARPLHATTRGYLKVLSSKLTDVFPAAWAKLSLEERQRWLDLPNFNAEKFLQITGVDVRKPRHLVRVRLPDGTVAKLEAVE